MGFRPARVLLFVCALISFETLSLQAQEDGSFDVEPVDPIPVPEQPALPPEAPPSPPSSQALPENLNSSAVTPSPTSLPAPAEAAPIAPPSLTPSPIVSPEDRNLKHSVITTDQARVTSRPDPASTAILMLTRGNEVDVLDVSGLWALVRFTLEGDFPVTGWLPLNAMYPPQPKTQKLPNLRPSSQAYVADPKSTPSPQVENFPTNLEQQPGTPSPMQTKAFQIPKAKEVEEKIPPRSVPKKGWVFSGQGGLGYKVLSESLTSRNPAGQSYASIPFLAYELSGISFLGEVRAGYAVPKWEYGGFLSYDYSLFSGAVPQGSTSIVSSGVQSQMHFLRVGPYLSYDGWTYKGVHLRPSAQIELGYHAFFTNQLQDAGTTTRNGQPVIFNHSGIFGMFKLKPRFEILKYDIDVEPDLGISFLYSHKEQVVSVRDTAGNVQTLKTGTPKSPGLSLQYGLGLGWNARRLRKENLELRFQFTTDDMSRAYSGLGDRAGFQTSDVKTSTLIRTYSLQVRYRF